VSNAQAHNIANNFQTPPCSNIFAINYSSHCTHLYAHGNSRFLFKCNYVGHSIIGMINDFLG
jgi:hypothetical protein